MKKEKCKKNQKKQVSLFVFSGDKLSRKEPIDCACVDKSPTTAEVAVEAGAGGIIPTNPFGLRKPEVEDFLFLFRVVDVDNDEDFEG